MGLDSKNTVAFVFPGQGSQHVGMLQDFSQAHPIINETFDEASQALGFDLWQLIQQGPQERLNLTENAQPALVAASIAIWRLWENNTTFKPCVMAGHSLGEWSALVAAQVLSLADAVKLVKLRGQFMQSAVPVGIGAMAAIIGLSDEQVERVCEHTSNNEGQVLPVNYNSPGQLVIAGHTKAVEHAIVHCKEAGAKRALALPVSAPFHTPLMEPAAQQLSAYIQETTFSSPAISVVQNVGINASSDLEKIKQRLTQQIYAPVPWVGCIHHICQHYAVDTVLECGPGKVLSGLNKRIEKQLNVLSTATPAVFDTSLETLGSTL